MRDNQIYSIGSCAFLYPVNITSLQFNNRSIWPYIILEAWRMNNQYLNYINRPKKWPHELHELWHKSGKTSPFFQSLDFFAPSHLESHAVTGDVSLNMFPNPTHTTWPIFRIIKVLDLILENVWHISFDRTLPRWPAKFHHAAIHKRTNNIFRWLCGGFIAAKGLEPSTGETQSWRTRWRDRTRASQLKSKIVQNQTNPNS